MLSRIDEWNLSWTAWQYLPPKVRASHKCFKFEFNQRFKQKQYGVVSVNMDYSRFTCDNEYFEAAYTDEEIIVNTLILVASLIHSFMHVKYFLSVARSFNNF
jgi:hypothetical protein